MKTAGTAGRAGKAAGIRQAAGQLITAARQAAGFHGRQAARQAIAAARQVQGRQNGRVLYYFRQAERAADRHPAHEN